MPDSSPNAGLCAKTATLPSTADEVESPSILVTSVLDGCRFPVKQDETTYPLDILLLGPYAVMQKSQALPELRQKFWRVIPVRVRHKTCNLLKIN